MRKSGLRRAATAAAMRSALSSIRVLAGARVVLDVDRGHARLLECGHRVVKAFGIRDHRDAHPLRNGARLFH
jgi:hypothetical protein